MASKNPELSRAVIEHANAWKRPGDVERLTAARTALATAKIADFIQRTLSVAPPLSAEQRARLARLVIEEGAP